MKNLKKFCCLILILSGLFYGLIASQPAMASSDFSVSCPRILASPEAQSRLDKGEKPTITRPRFRPEIFTQNGFCRIIVSKETNDLVQTYNETGSIAGVPLRVEFDEKGVKAFAGEKATPFADMPHDMSCSQPGEQLQCWINVDANAGIQIVTLLGGSIDEARVVLTPEALFGIDIRVPSHEHHDANFSANASSGVRYTIKPTNCSQAIWQNTAITVAVSTGNISGNQIVGKSGFQITGQSLTSPIFGPQFEANGDMGQRLADSILSHQAVEVQVQRACEPEVKRAFDTNRARLMNEIYKTITPRIMRAQ